MGPLNTVSIASFDHGCVALYHKDTRITENSKIESSTECESPVNEVNVLIGVAIAANILSEQIQIRTRMERT